MEDFVVKMVGQLGLPGLALYLAYKLADRYLGQFLGSMGEFVKVNAQQAQAIVDVATVVKESRDDQRDVVMTIRVMADKLDQVIKWVKEIDEKVEKAGK